MDTSELWNRWKEHIPLLVGGATTIFLAMRLLGVARYDPETAYGILQAGGTTAIVLGAVISLIGAACPAVCALCIVRLLSLDVKGRQGLILLATTLGILSYYLGPIEIILIMSALLVVSFIDRLRTIRSRRAHAKILASGDVDELKEHCESLDRQIAKLERAGKVTGMARLVTFAIGVAVIAILPAPWLPAVSLTLDHGRPFTAYILSSGNGLVVLTDDSRQVEYINSNDVTRKFVCTTGSDWLNEPIPLLLSSHTRYPQCPK